MRNTLLFLLLIGVIACDNTSNLNYAEKRLVGNWIYTNVDYRPMWGFKKDITGDYFGVEMIFNADRSFQINNLVNNTTEFGVWQVNEINGLNSNGNSGINYQLFFSFEQTSTGTIIQEVWDNITVSRNRVIGFRQEKDASYCYEIKRK